MIPIYQPSISGNEIPYVLECLESGWISAKGKYTEIFQEKFSKYTGSKYSYTASNGTVAIHLALLALGIGPGDEVIVPTLTYVATVNPVQYVGATPVFCDSSIGDWQIDPTDIERKITDKTKAIIVVHLYGQPADMKTICDIAKKYDLKVIEDCAEAFGSKIDNRHVGTFGDVSTYSFFGNKTITTGEGGMVCTDDINIGEKIEYFKSQAVDKNKNYWHNDIGYNYRMTNIQAAIGVAQLENVNKVLKRKRELFNLYNEGIKHTKYKLQQENKNTTHSFWMCSIISPTKEDKLKLIGAFEKSEIEYRPVFYPIHTMPMYTHLSKEDFPVATSISERSINIPSWPDLTNQQIDLIINTIISADLNEERN